MSVLLLPPIFQFFDNNGDPLANGFVDTFAAGTTTRLATYTDASGLTAAPNPIQLNAAGRPSSGSGAIWGQGAYKFIVRDANGVQVGDVLDNVISFNSLATAASAYAQTFSGNGTQTIFTTSDDLGTDPKGLLVFTATGLQEVAVNGSFATDTGWTKGAGWTIGSGVAAATGAISTSLSQVPVISLVAGQAYAVTYTVTVSAGSITPALGGQTGVARNSGGTYREIIVAAATTPISFNASGFSGTLDNVSITVATGGEMALLPTTAYTISGTTLTFAAAPALGVNNIDVRAPSLFLGAATTAANLAQLYAANALTSQAAAAASAALAASSVKWKPAVACATTANITLSGEQTIDGVLTSGSRVLVKNQANAIQNGVYISAAGSWARATDADTWTEIQSQAVYALSGTANSNTSWVNTNEAGGTVGTDNITWTRLYINVNGAIDGITSINSGQLAGFRNAITNGAFTVAQRTPSATNVTLNTPGYTTVDRFFSYQNTAVSVQTSAAASGLTGFEKCLKWGRPAGQTNSGITVLGQVIETENSVPFAGKRVTLSFYAKAGANFSPAGSTIGVQLYSGTGTNQAAADMVTGAWAGSATPINQSASIATSWARYQYTATLGASITQLGVYLTYTPSGTAGADDYLYITGVQLEVGTVATTFENRFFATELALCQRRYRKSERYSISPFTAGSQTISAVAQANIANGGYYYQAQFSTSMAYPPTVVTYPFTTPTNTGRSSNGAGTDYGANSAAVAGITTEGFGVTNSSGGVLTASANQLIIFGYTAESEL